ncbi:MAG TPA: FG-GAP-like repeat-containing protein [Candidatus Sulfotelmatobacter sp.]|nr:FG-GAP-like repeat-containing protein [Candidatus Sulfotelmatobacter sp.]
MSKSRFRSVALVAVALVSATVACSNSPSPISVSLTPSSPQTIDQGQTVTITANVINDRNNQGVSWKLTGSGTLTSGNGPFITYNPPNTPLTGPQLETVTATSMADSTKSASVQITVNALPQIPFQTLANGTVGTAYTQTIALTGGTGPFQWSVYNGAIATGWQVGGAVPDGLMLNATTGVVSGTPTGAGTWYFEVTVTDATGLFAVNALSIRINSNALPGNPVPFLNQGLVPTSVPPGSSDLVLNVSGAGFVPGATVDFNNSALSTTFVDSDHLSAIVPAAKLTAAGTALVTVRNSSPGGGRSNLVSFELGVPQTTVSFANAPGSPLQVSGASGLVVADFNEDGKLDLAATGGFDAFVFLGKGDGTFTPASGSPLPIPTPPYEELASPLAGPGLTVGDFNGSGHTGFAVGLLQNAAAVIFFGKGDGSFAYSSTPAQIPGGDVMALVAADLNRDGNLDLAAANNATGFSPMIGLGYGHGAFNNVEQNVVNAGSSLSPGDFNGDGKLDLAMGGTVLLGNGDGTFTQGPIVDPNTSFVAVADFNGDGKLDLAVCDNAANTVTIVLGNGDGTFFTASGSPITVGLQPDAIIAADFNNDGNLDLAVANGDDATLTLLLGNGDGTFTPASGSPFPVGHSPVALAAADFNSDGKLDLAVANLSDGTISILLQQ